MSNRTPCPMCGKPAPRATEVVWRPSASALASDQPWDYRGNKAVIKRGWGYVVVWDGETYQHRYDPFCTLRCAANFAHASYRAGYRIVKRPTKETHHEGLPD